MKATLEMPTVIPTPEKSLTLPQLYLTNTNFKSKNTIFKKLKGFKQQNDHSLWGKRFYLSGGHRIDCTSHASNQRDFLTILQYCYPVDKTILTGQ